MIPRALVVSHNWHTHETLTTEFDGEGAADKAAGWAHEKSFLWRDFPAADGWEHFAHWNQAAGKERGERVAKEVLTKGTLTESVPK